MKNILSVFIFVAAAAMAAGCGASKVTEEDATGDVPTDGPTDAWPERDGPVDYNDSDGDCISDTDEGKFISKDTDSDGTPDYLDPDSDGDTIPDRDEAGRPCDRIDLLPLDSDRDGMPNFQDTDSDGNGIADAQEGTADRDGDGIPDYADTDNDGDNANDIIEISGCNGGTPANPSDADGDGTPDYNDTDSDDDTICDTYETTTDTDGDTILDRCSSDADGDGLTDQLEGDVASECGSPVDTDADGRPDYRDPDSDDDGLPDGYEWTTSHTNFRAADSDGDGVTDLIEVAAGTDPMDPADNPRIRGNFVFEVPYNEDPIPPMDTLVFSTDIQQADVYFLIDTTASMGGEIDNLTTTLSTTVIPSIRDEILDVWFGVGAFDDYPIAPYGSNVRGDRPFYQVQRMTDSADQAQAAVESLVVHFGDDRPESDVTALYTVATGLGDGVYIDPPTECTSSERGYACFRARSLPIIILITDAPFHNGPGGENPYTDVPTAPRQYDEMLAALIDISAKVIGVNSGWARSHLARLAGDTGTADLWDNTLVFDIYADGNGLGEQIVTAVSILANQVPIEVSTEPVDDPSDAVDATRFINRIVPNTDGGISAPDDPTVICVGGLETANTDADPYDDVFPRVLPGTVVCFDIYVNINDFQPATSEVQTYKAIINVIGDGVTVLDSRDVYFFIPPEIPVVFG
jgi:hypothetical protein